MSPYQVRLAMSVLEQGRGAVERASFHLRSPVDIDQAAHELRLAEKRLSASLDELRTALAEFELLETEG